MNFVFSIYRIVEAAIIMLCFSTIQQKYVNCLLYCK